MRYVGWFLCYLAASAVASPLIGMWLRRVAEREVMPEAQRKA